MGEGGGGCIYYSYLMGRLDIKLKDSSAGHLLVVRPDGKPALEPKKQTKTDRTHFQQSLAAPLRRAPTRWAGAPLSLLLSGDSYHRSSLRRRSLQRLLTYPALTGQKSAAVGGHSRTDYIVSASSFLIFQT